MRALLDGYISVGQIRNAILREETDSIRNKNCMNKAT